MKKPVQDKEKVSNGNNLDENEKSKGKDKVTKKSTPPRKGSKIPDKLNTYNLQKSQVNKKTLSRQVKRRCPVDVITRAAAKATVAAAKATIAAAKMFQDEGVRRGRKRRRVDSGSDKHSPQAKKFARSYDNKKRGHGHERTSPKSKQHNKGSMSSSKKQTPSSKQQATSSRSSSFCKIEQAPKHQKRHSYDSFATTNLKSTPVSKETLRKVDVALDAKFLQKVEVKLVSTPPQSSTSIEERETTTSMVQATGVQNETNEVEYLAASPITCNTPDRNIELLSNTENISPISIEHETRNETREVRFVAQTKPIGRAMRLVKLVTANVNTQSSPPSLPPPEKKDDKTLLTPRPVPNPSTMPKKRILKGAKVTSLFEKRRRKFVNFSDPEVSSKVFYEHERTPSPPPVTASPTRAPTPVPEADQTDSEKIEVPWNIQIGSPFSVGDLEDKKTMTEDFEPELNNGSTTVELEDTETVTEKIEKESETDGERVVESPGSPENDSRDAENQEAVDKDDIQRCMQEPDENNGSSSEKEDGEVGRVYSAARNLSPDQKDELRKLLTNDCGIKVNNISEHLDELLNNFNNDDRNIALELLLMYVSKQLPRTQQNFNLLMNLCKEFGNTSIYER